MFKLPRLKPKEDKFFALLGQMAAQASASAQHLKTFVESADAAEKDRAGRAIAETKALAKTLSMQVTRELCRTYITPFDREDIQDFATELYKIPKIIEKIKDRMQAHGLSGREGEFSRQTDLIAQAAEGMESMVRDLVRGHDSKRIVVRAEAIQNLEQTGDAVLGELLVALLRDGNSARDMILRKDIYDMLERVIDRYRDAADVAVQIVLKHS